jgi:putative membrane protein
VSALSPEVLIATIAYTLLGLLVFGGSLWLVTLVAPFSIRKEIEDDQNTALGIMIGAMFIGIALIISAAISG